MEAYCVIHEPFPLPYKGFKILDYNTFKESGDESTVRFIGTYKECLDFISRSTAAQELVDSANREHKVQQPYYHGDSNHSVRELESICRQYKEYVHQLMTRETYTREEVQTITKRVAIWILQRINENTNIDFHFSDKAIQQIINSEIDTVKLF